MEASSDPGKNIPGLGPMYSVEFIRGEQHYELKEHRDNVQVVISDKKIGIDTNNDGVADYYLPDVVLAQDYYPFGLNMPARSYNAIYPYSYNGKRDDKEAGIGYQDYGMREYDKLTSRFISKDPLAKSFPWNSPYAYAEGDVRTSGSAVWI